ncbi:MAG: DUF6745 domain-containing protein [Cyanobacteria bacterium P01_G01_bin.54]
MSKPLITQLTDAQEARLVGYCEKWQAIAARTQSSDPEDINEQKSQITEIVNTAYRLSHFPEPEIWFYDNPYDAIARLLEIEDHQTYLGRSIYDKFQKRVFDHLDHLIQRQLGESLFCRLRNPTLRVNVSQAVNTAEFRFSLGMGHRVADQISKDFDFDNDASRLVESLSMPVDWVWQIYMIDFCISVLRLEHDRQKWEVIQGLIEHCGFLLQFEKVCVVCDRPSKLLFDHDNLLHAEGEPALQFADGYGVYAFHGREIPEGRYCEQGEYVAPGTRVKLTHTGEYGMVIHCWDGGGFFDYYIAFYGDAFPDQQTHCQPYVFRYATSSLQVLEER